MASIGLKYLAWAPIATEPTNAVPTYGVGRVLGKMISMNLAITNSEGKLFADDMLAEYISEFSSAEFTAETDNISLADQAALYGATFADDELRLTAGDNAPYGAYGGYQQLSVNNVRKYRAWIFAKGKASVPDETGATKGESVSFGNQPLKVTVSAPNFGPWKKVKEFSTEAAAKAYVDTALGVATWHNIGVQVNGAGTGEGASPVGVTPVADAGSFELVITGTVTALYDNGTEVSASIADGKYTLSNVTADHTISVIF
jgi:hypothetical protein